MSKIPNSSKLFIDIEQDTVSVRHVEGDIIVQWNFDDLSKQLNKKIPALMLVHAHSEMRGGVEYFKFNRARLMRGTNSHIIREQIDEGNILIDLRLHDAGTRGGHIITELVSEYMKTS